MRQRITGAVGLLVLGTLALVFLGTQVTRCIGPLGGRTMVEAVRDGCISPSVGAGMPIFVAALVAGVLVLLPRASERPRQSLIGAVGGVVAGLVAYLVLRPTLLTGATTAGDVITVPLPFDWWALLSAGIAGAGAGWLLGVVSLRSRSSLRPSRSA